MTREDIIGVSDKAPSKIAQLGSSYTQDVIRIKTREREYFLNAPNSNLKTVWLIALKNVVNSNKP